MSFQNIAQSKEIFKLKKISFTLLLILFIIGFSQAQKRVVKRVFNAKGADEYISVEAENFDKQTKNSKRRWYEVNQQNTPNIKPDGDSNHANGSSKNAYLEILPDTRRTSEPIVLGQNLSEEPGKVGVLSYDIKFKTTGKYYVWVRSFSSGTEDDGIHVGIDGTWPESGKNILVCNEKGRWIWTSQQDSGSKDCHNKRSYLMINEPGRHEIMFSMKEDGFEFDKWVMTKYPEVIPK